MYLATNFIDSIGTLALVNKKADKKRVGQCYVDDLILNQSKKYRSAVANAYSGSQLKYLLIDIKTSVIWIRYKYDKIDFSIN
ncbi:hypothetical protein TKWG_00770 [Advenella kashmirensis WT001]|uniref:Uncharacterized protein n=1 Tax=Advenella kashmirensis (strain DSM 17095 / LMG 22695 / WT001) TaxID=1036672 RepID=I3U769_ADVKW|nr:hypothetical protein TKWG_00770 [Advenella kashmirensis WT001]